MAKHKRYKRVVHESYMDYWLSLTPRCRALIKFGQAIERHSKKQAQHWANEHWKTLSAMLAFQKKAESRTP